MDFGSPFIALANKVHDFIWPTVDLNVGQVVDDSGIPVGPDDPRYQNLLAIQKQNEAAAQLLADKYGVKDNTWAYWIVGGAVAYYLLLAPKRRKKRRR